MKKIEIFLCDLTHTGQTIASDIIPLNIGYVGSYLKKRFNEDIVLKLFKYPESLNRQLEISPPRIVGFSCYSWSFRLSCKFAEIIKQRFPDVVVVFGGPNYPMEEKKQYDFLLNHNYIDFFVPGEGEEAVAGLVELLMKNEFSVEAVKDLKPRNCHFIRNNQMVKGEMFERLIDLTEVPSPYLTGLLDPFFDNKLLPIIQTRRGCPFSCTYCTQGTRFYNKIASINNDLINDELEYIARNKKEMNDLQIADSNFAMYDDDLITCRKIANIRERFKWPVYLHAAAGKNRKDLIIEGAQILGGSLRIAGSVQSTDPTVLKNIKRDNVSLDQIFDVAKQTESIGGNPYSEVIMGLPGDSKSSHLRSIADLLEAGFNIIFVYPLLMLPGAEVSTGESREKYKMVTKFRVIPRCFGSYNIFNETINVSEIDEICVANATMSFDDYLECRKFVLTLNLFYNDGVFSEVAPILKEFDILVFEWLCFINDNVEELSSDFKVIYNDFLSDTRDELWSSREELAEFTSSAENIKRLVDGEIGYNIIYKYRSKALVTYLDSLHDIAFGALERLIDVKKVCYDKNVLHELKRFSLLKKSKLFDTACDFVDSFSYNFIDLLLDASSIKSIKKPNPTRIRFFHDETQMRTIDEKKKLYGSDFIGISRILVKTHVKKLFRNVEVL
ncbi:MAG: radical SAM protein [Candidatus Scalindua sp.]|jgi:radical SAM superfamily enzyme YgiQ (UPF0313 family)|nr:radical SAM protein [Candidatus Scalindua sp.]MBT6229929.1 radical SAM protein [Candidatus Scalindua sp.]